MRNSRPIKKEKMPSPKRTQTGLISRSRPGHKSSWISFSLFFLIFLCCFFFYFSEIQRGREKRKKVSDCCGAIPPCAISSRVQTAGPHNTKYNKKKLVYFSPLQTRKWRVTPDTIEINSKSWFFPFFVTNRSAPTVRANI